MKLVRETINKNISSYPDFEYYFTILDKIEQHEITQPDICIESCKSLIEGVSKSVIIRLDNTISQKEVNKMDLLPLYRKAMNVLSDKSNEEIELDFLIRFSQIIQILGELRNQRGDISHGKSVPKENVSSQYFAQTIKGFTDHIVFYILNHFFLIEQVDTDKLEYEDLSLEDFNLYLNAKVEQFPIENIAYSRALYDYDYISYKIEYDKYMTDKEIDEALEIDIPFKYNSYTFWTSGRMDLLNAFCEKNKLHSDMIISIIDTVWAENTSMLNSKILESMIIMPAIDMRDSIVKQLRGDIEQMMQQLKNKEYDPI